MNLLHRLGYTLVTSMFGNYVSCLDGCSSLKGLKTYFDIKVSQTECSTYKLRSYIAEACDLFNFFV